MRIIELGTNFYTTGQSDGPLVHYLNPNASKTIKMFRYDFVKKLIESQNAQTIVDLGCAGNGTEHDVPLFENIF